MASAPPFFFRAQTLSWQRSLACYYAKSSYMAVVSYTCRCHNFQGRHATRHWRCEWKNKVFLQGGKHCRCSALSWWCLLSRLPQLQRPRLLPKFIWTSTSRLGWKTSTKKKVTVVLSLFAFISTASCHAVLIFDIWYLVWYQGVNAASAATAARESNLDKQVGLLHVYSGGHVQDWYVHATLSFLSLPYFLRSMHTAWTHVSSLLAPAIFMFG